jgi:ADP-ribose pyrophosphatase
VYERVSSEVACERFNFDVVDSSVSGPGGVRFARSWARHPPTVAAVGLTADLHVPLIRQYRVAIDQQNLELPGGRIDPADASPGAAAARELEEEVGLRPRTIEPLGSFLNSPGHCSQETLLFLATDLAPRPRALDADEESTSEVELVPLSELDDLLVDGRIRDAKTTIGLMLAARKLGL